MALTQVQLDYVKSQVEANTGFRFIDAGESSIDKFYMHFVTPQGNTRSFSQPVRNNKEWLTDDAQFRDVVAHAVSWMVQRYSDL